MSHVARFARNHVIQRPIDLCAPQDFDTETRYPSDLHAGEVALRQWARDLASSF
jgi:hypothetical protein